MAPLVCAVRPLTVLVVSLAVAGAPLLAAAAPTISKMSLHGLQAGGTTTVVFEGKDLAPAPQVVLPVPIASQKVLPGEKSNRVEIEIILDAAVSPGIHYLRLANSGGISNPVAVGIDALPQRPFAEQIETLPVALSGVVAGDQILQTKLQGAAGQPIVVDVESQRLGGQLRPVVRLYDQRGAQLDWCGPRQQLGGDARFTAVLPADGQYTIELHDMLYRAPGQSFFRLKVGQFNYADVAYPVGVERGAENLVSFPGSTLPPQIKVELTGQPMAAGQQAAQLPAALNLSGAAPRIVASDHAELLESPPADGGMQELPQAPIAINGRLGAKGEEDRYLLAVKPGAKLRFDVAARDIGSPLDGVLSVRNEQGGQLAANDDVPTAADPRLDFTVPDGVEKIVVALRDLLGRGGDQFVYRIAVSDLGAPDFSLTFDAESVNLPAGGTQVIRVQAARRGYRGPIKLEVHGLPEGVKVAGDVIGQGRQVGLLTLTAPAGAPVHGLATIVGRSTAPDTSIVRVAQAAETPAAKYQPSLRNNIGMALAAAAPISIDWGNSGEGENLPLGGAYAAQVKVNRAADAKGAVRLKLLTTQIPPKKTVKENNRDVQVDDVERTLRLEGEPQIAADQSESTAKILIPADLPKGEWGLVLVAELLAADNKTVLVSTSTPVRGLAPVSPLSIELASEPSAAGKAGAGDTGKFSGKIVRSGGFDKPVVVTLDGLPEGYKAPSVTVAADKSEFELPLRFAYGAKAGELNGVKLVATYAPNPEDPKVVLRSNELAVNVNVVPGEKPPAEAPKEIFEDDAKFVELLSMGAGQVSLESSDKYWGQASIKVTPDQRYNETVPSLGVKIREKPAPGEFRYLRFAWKKVGGEAICLQINHDGAWGPGGSGKEGAKFRYHAGPAGECYGASLALDDKLPAEFVVVTRDLFADFGEFTFSGIAFSPVDGDYALFDHLYLAKDEADFELIKPPAAPAEQTADANAGG